MNGTTVHSSEACELVRRLEEILEYRIVCFVGAGASYDLSFVFPAGGDVDEIAPVLAAIGSACDNALKSL